MAGERNKKETIRFSRTVVAGANLSGINALFQDIKSAGTIQRIFGKFYAGQQLQLQVRPYLRMAPNRDEELITYTAGSNRFIAGDDIAFDMHIDFDVNSGDRIILDVTNVSTFDYTLEINFEVDYVGGTSRVV